MKSSSLLYKISLSLEARSHLPEKQRLNIGKGDAGEEPHPTYLRRDRNESATSMRAFPAARRSQRRMHDIVAKFLVFFLCFLGGTSCRIRERARSYPIVYDFAKNLHLAEVKREPMLINFGTPAARKHMKSGWSADEIHGKEHVPFAWGVGEGSSIEFFLAPA